MESLSQKCTIKEMGGEIYSPLYEGYYVYNGFNEIDCFLKSLLPRTNLIDWWEEKDIKKHILIKAKVKIWDVFGYKSANKVDLDISVLLESVRGCIDWFMLFLYNNYD